MADTGSIDMSALSSAKLHRALYSHRGRTRNPRAILERVNFRAAGVQPINRIPEETTYLQPDEAFVGRLAVANDGSPNGDLWIESTPSTALRSVDFKSNSSFRGHLPYRAGNRSLAAESMIEARVVKLLQANRKVVNIRDQWPLVGYADENGELHQTVFDYWVLLDNQQSIAIAVKNASRVRSSGIIQKLRLIAKQGVGGFADGVALFTDAKASLDNDYNAGWILRARRTFNRLEYQAALDRIEGIRGSVRFHDLLIGAPFEGGRRTAIWNLIDEGILVPDERGKISDLSFLHRDDRP